MKWYISMKWYPVHPFFGEAVPCYDEPVLA